MRRIAFTALFLFLFQSTQARLEFNKGDRVLLYGNSFVERLQEHGLFEANMQLAHPDKDLEFRSLAWTGDEVDYRLRPNGYANHLRDMLNTWPTDVVLACFGMNESTRGNPVWKGSKSASVSTWMN